MFWSIVEEIYAWLWPLFEPCHDPTLTLVHQADVPFATRFGNNIIRGVQPAELTVCLCPTPMMHLLLLVAGIGLAFLVVALLREIVNTLVGKPSEPQARSAAYHDAVAAILHELDKTSDDYVRRVRNL